MVDICQFLVDIIQYFLLTSYPSPPPPPVQAYIWSIYDELFVNITPKNPKKSIVPQIELVIQGIVFFCLPDNLLPVIYVKLFTF